MSMLSRGRIAFRFFCAIVFLMNKEPTREDRILTSRGAIVGFVALAAVLGTGIQIAHDQASFPAEPTISIENPFSWAATPLDKLIDGSQAHETQYGVNYIPPIAPIAGIESR